MIHNTNDILKRHKIRLVKSLGQNFLIDNNIVEKIVDSGEVKENDLIIEIGPGIGSMTVELAKKAGKVIAVEIDKHLIPALQENLKEFDNVEIINQDILKVSLDEIIRRENAVNVKVIANLPYYITTPIIMSLLEKQININKMIFMIQKEVAQRMVSIPGKKEYGALSVAVQYYSEPEILFNVSPKCFLPRPEVESSVIRLNINKVPKVDLVDKNMFFKTVKASFAQRRKTLLNALSNSSGFGITKDEYKEIFKELNIHENQRGETLTIQQFALLSNTICRRIKNRN